MHCACYYNDVPIDFQMLKEKGNVQCLETYRLSFYSLDSTRRIILTLSEAVTTQPEHFLKLHFESFTGKESVENVELLQHNKAVVIFKDPQSK